MHFQNCHICILTKLSQLRTYQIVTFVYYIKLSQLCTYQIIITKLSLQTSVPNTKYVFLSSKIKVFFCYKRLRIIFRITTKSKLGLRSSTEASVHGSKMSFFFVTNSKYICFLKLDLQILDNCSQFSYSYFQL